MSILYYQPTGGILETGRKVRAFTTEYMPVFWDILKPLIPYLSLFLLLDLLFNEFVMTPDPETGKQYDVGIFGIFSSYLITCIAITWHRVVIHGPDNYTPVNPLKPTKSELLFIGTILGIFISFFIIGFTFGVVTQLIMPMLMPVVLIGMIVFLAFLAARLSFYFPSKATGGDLTLKQAYQLSRGYVLRLIFTPFVAMWRVIFLYIGYVIIGVAVMYGFGYIIGQAAGEGLLSVILLFLFGLPIQIYFEPLLAVMAVTVLSNFYQHALQNLQYNFDAQDKAEEAVQSEEQIAEKLNDIEPS